MNVNVNKCKYCFGVLYRPPRENLSRFFDTFEEALGMVIPQCDDLFVGGDININLLDFDNVNSCRFVESLEAFGLRQLVDRPTRLTPDSETLIDIAAVSADCFSFAGLESLHGLTDHELIRCRLTSSVPKVRPIIKSYRDYRAFKFDSFNRDLELLPLTLLYQIRDVDTKVNYFNKLILSLFDKHAPVKTRRFTKKNLPRGSLIKLSR